MGWEPQWVGRVALIGSAHCGAELGSSGPEEDALLRLSCQTRRRRPRTTLSICPPGEGVDRGLRRYLPSRTLPTQEKCAAMCRRIQCSDDLARAMTLRSTGRNLVTAHGILIAACVLVAD